MFTYCRTGTSGSLQKLKLKVSATPVLASASRPPMGAHLSFTLQLGMQSTSSRPILSGLFVPWALASLTMDRPNSVAVPRPKPRSSERRGKNRMI